MASVDRKISRQHLFTAKYVMLLLLACVVGWFGLNIFLFASGRVPLWKHDAYSQYVNFFIWEGCAIRDAIGTFIVGGGLSFPMYTYSIGYGADTILSMSNTLRDPLNIISALCPQQFALYLFVALVIVRIILSALTFSYYCLRRGNSKSASFIAALTYTFGGYIVFWGMLRHPFFINAAILLPLFLSGADDMFEKKYSNLFTMALALQLLISVYFSFMACLILLVYCLIKYFFVPYEHSLADFFSLVFCFIGSIVLAVLIASISVLPNVISLLSMERVTGDRILQLFYAFGHYAALPSSLTGSFVHTRGMYIGVVGSVFLAIFLLCRKKIDSTLWKPWAFGLGTVFLGLILPYVGHVMNGFSYSSDRWMFAMNFCVSYIVCLGVPVLQAIGQTEKRKVMGLLVVLGCLSFGGVVQSPVMPIIVVIFFVTASYLLLFIVPRFSRRFATMAISATVLFYTALVCNLGLIASDWIFLNDFSKPEKAIHMLQRSAYTTLLEDESRRDVFRVSLPRRSGSMKNTTLNYDTKLIDYYSSIYNQGIDSFRTGLGISDEFFNYRFSGSDSRFAIDAFSGARFFVASEEFSWRVPFTYANTGREIDSYTLYETNHCLPLAFTAHKVISQNKYEGLSMVQKQEALLQACVLDDTVDVGAPAVASPTFFDESVAFNIQANTDVDNNETSFLVLSDDSSVTVTFSGLSNCETYLVIRNLQFTDYLPSELLNARLQNQSKVKMLFNNLVHKVPTRSSIFVHIGEHTKGLEFGTALSPQYGGKKDWVLNLGYSEKPLTEMSISFEEPGLYTFDSIEVVCQPVEPLVEMVDTMAEGGADNIELAQNHISATFSGGGLGVFTIPYSKGWTATVDGVKADILQADVGFMAVPLEGSGKHQVELSYCTPGLKIGAVFSLAGIVLFTVLVILLRKRSTSEKAVELRG